MALNFRNLILMVISMVIVVLVLPQGVVYAASFGDQVVVINGTSYIVEDVVPPAATMLIETLLPIIACAGILFAFLPSLYQAPLAGAQIRTISSFPTYFKPTIPTYYKALILIVISIYMVITVI